MTKRAILLLAVSLLCSLTLVNAQYQVRRLFIALEHAEARQAELEIAWAQLQLEQSLLAKHARIETQAKNVLNMMLPGENRTQYLTAGGR